LDIGSWCFSGAWTLGTWCFNFPPIPLKTAKNLVFYKKETAAVSIEPAAVGDPRGGQ
jgi:hypothetical protein